MSRSRRMLDLEEWAVESAEQFAHEEGSDPSPTAFGLGGTAALDCATDLVWLAVADVPEPDSGDYDAAIQRLIPALVALCEALPPGAREDLLDGLGGSE